MKVLILSCLVALALAKETIESFSSSEQKPKFEHEKQQIKEDEHQDKMQFFVQLQPLLCPHTEPISYTVPPQKFLPLAQPSMLLPILHSQVMEVPSTKETIFPKRHMMPIVKSPVAPIFERQIPNLPQFPLPQFQPLMQQVPQSLFQTPILPTQPLLSLSQPKALPLSQQVMVYGQRIMPNQEILLDPAQVFFPVTEPIASVYNVKQN